jgi:hypothetical protein
LNADRAPIRPAPGRTSGDGCFSSGDELWLAAWSTSFEDIERFYNAIRRHSTIGYLSPVEFERNVGLA